MTRSYVRTGKQPADLTKTALYDKFGIRGLKLFARIWFPIVYGFLLVLAALTEWHFLFLPASRSLFISVLIIVLVLIALTILTKMFREFTEGIHLMESAGIDEPPDAGADRT